MALLRQFLNQALEDISNYRPIFILNVMPRLFEKIVTAKLSYLLGQLIYDEQHGFVQARSTVTNLAVFNNYVSAALDSEREKDTQ